MDASEAGRIFGEIVIILFGIWIGYYVGRYFINKLRERKKQKN